MAMMLGAAGMAGGAVAADGHGGMVTPSGCDSPTVSFVIGGKTYSATVEAAPLLTRFSRVTDDKVTDFLTQIGVWIAGPSYAFEKSCGIDGNVRRVLSDLEWLRDNLSDGPNREALAQEIAVLIDALTKDLG